MASIPAIDGGPAFPTDGMTLIDGTRASTKRSGMSLRDYFAGQAMAAYLASPTTSRMATDNVSICAEWAYAQADAMLAEREK